jgi:hypothetical protein
MAFAGAAYSLVLIFGIGGVLHGLFLGNIWSLLLLLMALAALILPMNFFLSDAFAYTHYPIRLNRKNRQVYVFRRNGTVFKAGWDNLYWTIYNVGGRHSGSLNVMGHVLAKDGITVKESIGLSKVDYGEEGRQNLLQFFEFIRRYMEEGPGPVLKALEPMPLIMLPDIDRKRESWYFGWLRLTANMNGWLISQILLQIFFIPESLFRWMVMHTSKIPQWPQWVEDECAIDPNDPWLREPGRAYR